MREIKFRLRINERFYYYTLDELMLNKDNWGFISLITKDQYTGLRDKNNQEIYEGDIIKFSNYSGSRYRGAGKEKFLNTYWEVACLKDFVEFMTMGNLEEMSEFEVLGNKYEDLELLENI